MPNERSRRSARRPHHVTGLVERMCPDESHCFDLKVEPARNIAGESLRVRFADVEQIQDPKNYRLTLAQQNIRPRSHRRVLHERDAVSVGDAWHAILTWIGD